MNSILDFLSNLVVESANFIWGYPLLFLLIGGGLFFSIYIRFLPLAYFKHAIEILFGKHSETKTKGEITHFEALTSALAATVGMGNVGGVAFAIVSGGPGILFWMWVSASIGMITKFFTCSLSIMYRGKKAGGMMYVITKAMSKRWNFLAVLFCLAGMIGCLPIFQANQLTAILKDFVFIPANLFNQELSFLGQDTNLINIIVGIVLSILAGVVVFGGLPRLAQTCSRLVPLMVVLYMISVLAIIVLNLPLIPDLFYLIIEDAFTAKAVLGASVAAIIIAGVRRAAFSNEAGLGTATMAHGDAKTNEPIKEGLVAMLGPAIDTLIVCTCTGLAILITGVWQNTAESGVTVTLRAFESALPFGGYILLGCTCIFAITSMFSFGFYGAKCFHFLTGKSHHYYHAFYTSTIIFGAMASIKGVISLIDLAFALMAIPTMICSISLAPKVVREAKIYFKKIR